MKEYDTHFSGKYCFYEKGNMLGVFLNDGFEARVSSNLRSIFETALKQY